MPTVLQDRETVPAYGARPGRRSAGRVVAGVLGGGLVLALAVAGVDRAVDGLPGFGVPHEKVVDRPHPALLTALADLHDYHAAQGTYQVVVDLEKDTPYVPAAVKGERTTYLAVGTVDGVVDATGLSGDAVRTSGDAVTITLPAPHLGRPVVDPAQSRVVARDRGLVDRVGGVFSDSPTSERDLAVLAQGKVTEAAAQSDLLRRSEASTRAMLTGMARSFGYTQVTVEFTPAA